VSLTWGVHIDSALFLHTSQVQMGSLSAGKSGTMLEPKGYQASSEGFTRGSR
jgi:hypothetical protein